MVDYFTKADIKKVLNDYWGEDSNDGNYKHLVKEFELDTK